MCSRGGCLLDFKNEEYVVFYLLSGQDPASSVILLLWSFCYYGVSVHRGETIQPGAHLHPLVPPRSQFQRPLLCVRSEAWTCSSLIRVTLDKWSCLSLDHELRRQGLVLVVACPRLWALPAPGKALGKYLLSDC